MIANPDTICRRCGRAMPDAGSRLDVCGECRQAEIQKKLDEKAKAVMNRVLDENFMPTPGLPQLAETMSEIYQCFGGPRCFAQKCYEQMEKVMARQPASAATVQMLLRFLQLQMKVEEQQRSQQIADMTDDQLRREQDLALMKMILDAASDPKRRRQLDQLMGLQGIKLVQESPYAATLREVELEHGADDGSPDAEAAGTGDRAP